MLITGAHPANGGVQVANLIDEAIHALFDASDLLGHDPQGARLVPRPAHPLRRGARGGDVFVGAWEGVIK